MRLLLFVICYLLFSPAGAQTFSPAGAQDPVVMTIAGVDVPKSEFEYSYNKNNSEGVIDKKTVEEYVPLFVNYKLKVQAALDAHLDTMQSFKDEFAMYRDQQLRPSFVSDDDVEQEARRIYQQTADRIGSDGLVQTAHILILVPQQATAEEQQQAKVRIDSVYQALKAGANFEELAREVSQDPGSARQGGLLPYVERGQLVKEFEDVAFALQDGEMSGVVQTPYGYHIILKKGHKQFEPYEYHRESILQFIEQRGLRERLIDRVIQNRLTADTTLTKERLMEQRAEELSAEDTEMKYLIQEYHDGLLLYEISNSHVWDKAAKDEAGLQTYFKKHKKDYAWTAPRYKGMAYHVKEQGDVKAVSDCVKKLPFDQWGEQLRQTFNGDSIIRIRVEKGLFKQGDNALVDSLVFKKDTTVTHLKDYPIDAVYGKLLKKGPEELGDVRPLVVADYQELLEKQWVEELRRRYDVRIFWEKILTK